MCQPGDRSLSGIIPVTDDPAEPPKRIRVHLVAVEKLPFLQFLLGNLTLEQGVYFLRCSGAHHGHVSIELDHEGDDGNQIREEEIDRVVEVVEGRHQHQHRPQTGAGDHGGGYSLLELKDATPSSVECTPNRYWKRRNVPEPVRRLDRVLQNLCRQWIIKVVEGQAE